ncbi:hypothetical protein A8C56_23165 [Niabella ginsenosidivorans]|uniref:Uncharacterized protein n=1 Tax=Niabella ginsenosidivorans TaxID=1176587 RepID=A0A1A9I9T4_9BACT|nr:hypothetical protein A8C56_23165 [Niabella ginsenosidivorans]
MNHRNNNRQRYKLYKSDPVLYSLLSVKDEQGHAIAGSGKNAWLQASGTHDKNHIFFGCQ